MNDTEKENHERDHEQVQSIPSWLRVVRDHVNSLKYGTVQITVHDSQVTEIVKAEKTRFDRPKRSES